jgi:hypothetical protein
VLCASDCEIKRVNIAIVLHIFKDEHICVGVKGF